MLMRWQRGFSLAEMAIVLVIVGILMASGLGALRGQLSAQRLRESKLMLERANEALLGFALANNRLPCPANNLGVESRDVVTNRCVNAVPAFASFGDLPWQTLGLPELDPWGQRLRYQVTTFAAAAPANIGDYAQRNPAATPACGDAIAGQKPCFTLLQSGNLVVRNFAGQSLVTNAVAVVFSEGGNGLGTSAQEAENRNADANFVQDVQQDAPNPIVNPQPVFDDVLIWIPTTILNYRLTNAGRLP